MIEAPRRIPKPAYSTTVSGNAVDGGGSTVVTKVAPQLAQKLASAGLSCPQIWHFIDALDSRRLSLTLFVRVLNARAISMTAAKTITIRIKLICLPPFL